MARRSKMWDLAIDEDLWCIKTMMAVAARIDERKLALQSRIDKEEHMKKRRDEMHLAKLPEKRRKRIENRRLSRQLRDMQNPFLLPEKEFRENYIFPAAMAQSLIEELRPYLPATKMVFAIPLELKVLVALRYFAHGVNQKSFSECGFSQGSCSIALKEVVEALNSPAIFKKWIRFPETKTERNMKMARHHQEFGLPGVLGFVDGTYITIVPPPKKVGQKDYCCNKNFYALNVQLVCDSSGRILDINAHSPGSHPNSYVWHMTDTRKTMESIYRNGDMCWLIGDGSYPMEPWLLTPIVLTEHYPPGERYNAMVGRCLNITRRCISMIKTIFKCIEKGRPLVYNPQKSSRIVTACAVLFNMYQDANLPCPEITDFEEADAYKPFMTQGDYHLRQEGMQNVERITRNFP